MKPNFYHKKDHSIDQDVIPTLSQPLVIVEEKEDYRKTLEKLKAIYLKKPGAPQKEKKKYRANDPEIIAARAALRKIVSMPIPQYEFLQIMQRWDGPEVSYDLDAEEDSSSLEEEEYEDYYLNEDDTDNFKSVESNYIGPQIYFLSSLGNHIMKKGKFQKADHITKKALSFLKQIQKKTNSYLFTEDVMRESLPVMVPKYSYSAGRAKKQTEVQFLKEYQAYSLLTKWMVESALKSTRNCPKKTANNLAMDWSHMFLHKANAVDKKKVALYTEVWNMYNSKVEEEDFQ
jgi:ribosomal protein S7